MHAVHECLHLVRRELLDVAGSRAKLELDAPEEHLAIEVTPIAHDARPARVGAFRVEAVCCDAAAARAREDVGDGAVAPRPERELHLLVRSKLHHLLSGDGDRVDVGHRLRVLEGGVLVPAILPLDALSVLLAVDAGLRIHATPVPRDLGPHTVWVVGVGEAHVGRRRRHVGVVRAVAVPQVRVGIVGALALVHVGEVACKQLAEVKLVLAVDLNIVEGVGDVAVDRHGERRRRADAREG